MVEKKAKVIVSEKGLKGVVETTPSVEDPSNQKKVVTRSPIQTLLLNKNALIIAGIVVILLVVSYYLFIFAPSQYRFSFNREGVQYLSNTYTPTEFFSEFDDANSYAIIIDLKDGNNDMFLTNAERLWIIGTNASLAARGVKTGKVLQIVNYVNSSGQVDKCFFGESTIDQNFSGKMLAKEECAAKLSDPSLYLIYIDYGSSNSVILSEKKIEVFASNKTSIAGVNFLVITQFYPDFAKTLDIVNEKIGAVSE